MRSRSMMAPTKVCVLSLLLFFVLPCRGSPRIVENLQQDRSSPAYKQRLVTAGTAFYLWTLRHHLNINTLVTSPLRLNRTLIQYIQQLYSGKKPLWLATHTVLAIQTKWRALKGQLKPSWDSIQSWKLSRPIHSRIPMPSMVMKAVCYYGVMMALMYDQSRSAAWFSFVVTIRMGFYALMRPIEFLSILKSHIKLPSPWTPSGARTAVCKIIDPKNRAFMGRVQVRMIKDEGTIAWLAWFSFCLPEQSRVCMSCRKTMVGMFEQALNFFGIKHLGFTLASLRAGRATELLEIETPLANIQFAGSWTSQKALACYLQEAEAASIMLDVGKKSIDRIQYALKHFIAFEFPPVTPYSENHGPSASSRNHRSSRPCNSSLVQRTSLSHGADRHSESGGDQGDGSE